MENTTQAPSQLKRRIRNYLPHLPSDLFKIILVLVFVFPFYWMFVTAFKTYTESIQTPPTLWPKIFSLEGFEVMMEAKYSIVPYFVNTVLVTAAVIVLQLLVMVPAAYAFAKRKFPLANVLFIILMIGFMIPGQVTYIPIYLMCADLKILNSLWPQILPFVTNVFGIFMLRQSFKQIPDELLEAAKLDHAGEVQIMLRLMLPMCKSSMVTIALFSFVDHWNSYFWPLVMTTSDKYRPLTMYIEKIKDAEYGLIWPNIMAANVVLVVPVLIFFIFASRKIIEAFTYSGIK